MKKLGITLLLPAAVAMALFGWGLRQKHIRQQALNAQILAAGASNDWNRVRQLLSRGADPNTTHDSGQTILYEVVINNQIDLARELIRRGIDVTLTDPSTTPLTAAVGQNNYEMAKLLLDSGADKLLSSGATWTPLHVAVRQGGVMIAKLLIERGSDVNCPRPAGTPLVLAARGHCQGAGREITKLLLANGADVDGADAWGHTALNWAALRRDRILADLLLAHGANVTLFDAIALADWRALREIVELKPDLLNSLLGRMKHMAPHAAEYEAGISPLDAAIICGREQVMLWLLQKCARPDGPPDAAGLPLRTAVREGAERMTQALLQAGADANLADNAGWTALHWAAASNRLEHARLLLNAGAKVNFVDRAGWTPLAYALRNGQAAPIVSLLQAHGGLASPKATPKGATP